LLIRVHCQQGNCALTLGWICIVSMLPSTHQCVSSALKVAKQSHLQQPVLLPMNL
jgi:hypothetical protein